MQKSHSSLSRVKKNKFESYNTGSLPTGCQQCVRGFKSVIFVTGRCPRKCFYCPVSDYKMYKDVMYANERKVENIDEIVEEVRISKSKGAGLTGGDPLCDIKRTCEIIRRLKDEFGQDFHIHLYTSLNLVSEKYIQLLAQAGLDELRVHPDLYDKKLWDRIQIPRGKFKAYGIEVPVIPDREQTLQELIVFAQDFVDYANLNELEASCKNAAQFIARGLTVKQLSSYAVIGSMEAGLRLVSSDWKIPVHLCTCKLKDAVQLANRLKRRAKSIKRPLDYLTDEGMLYFGEVHLESAQEAQGTIARLADKHQIPERLYHVQGSVVTIAAWVLVELVNEFPGKKLLVTQYPTADKMRVQEEEI